MPLLVTTPPRRSARPRRARASVASKKIMGQLYAELTRMAQPMVADMLALAPWLASNPGPAIAAVALQQHMEKWRRILGPSIAGIAGKWTRAISEDDRDKLQKSLQRALGVEQSIVMDEEPVRNAIELMGQEAVQLIRTIPEEMWAKVQTATMRSYQELPQPEGRTLTEELQELGNITFERAKVIARDQTNKIHSVVTRARQVSLGIVAYTWRTAEDSRVVGTPGGLYPQGNRMHGNHFVRNGRIFWWQLPTDEQRAKHPDYLDPPEDGPPGWAIQCRCNAEPVIIIDELSLA